MRAPQGNSAEASGFSSAAMGAGARFADEGPTSQLNVTPADDLPLWGWITAHATCSPAAEFMITPTSVTTYGQLDARVGELVEWLSDSGLDPGCLTALISDGDADGVAMLVALLQLRFTVVPLTLRASGRHLGLLSGNEPLQIVSFAGNTPEFRMLPGPTEEGSLISNWLDRRRAGLFFFTSGSTGTPKGILHDVALLAAKYEGWSRRSSRSIRFLGFDHMGGVNTVFAQLATMGTAVSPRGSAVEEICAAIERFQIDFLPTTPTFLKMMLLKRAWNRYDLTSLRTVTYGSELMSEQFLARINDAMPWVKFKQTYGMTEVGVLPVESESSRSTWMRLKLPPDQWKITDGTLMLNVPSLMVGRVLFGTDDLSLRPPERAWLNTRDLVEVRPPYIKFVGRDSEIINVAGLKVYPGEVENVLLRHHEVASVRVGSEANNLVGQVVVAWVVAVGNPGEAHKKRLAKELRASCREHLQKYQVPQRIYFEGSITATPRLKLERR